MIILLAVVFHHRGGIVDAMTLEAADGYSVTISPWRTFLEPFLGLLLFFLRGELTLISFMVLLLWIAALFLVVSLYPGRNTGTEGGGGSRTGLLVWLRGMPMMAGLWLAVLWFLIVTPLPSNAIENYAEETILVNTHCHSDHSQDGIMTPERLQKWHRHNGFDAFFLTEHDEHLLALEVVGDQQSGRIPAEPLILCGEEYSGSNHMTLLGLDGSFSTPGLPEREVVMATQQAGGVVLVAHWFEEELESVPYYISLGVDGFEIANQAVGSYSREVFEQISQACRDNGLIMNGSVDNHGYGSTCGVWTALSVRGWEGMDMQQRREAVMDVLRRKDQGAVQVLLYQDRPGRRDVPLLVLPLVTMADYFRSLNGWQVLSWLIWLLLVRNLALLIRIPGKAGQVLRISAFAAGIYLVGYGIIFYLRTLRPEGYTGVYSRYSMMLVTAGSFLLVYLLVLALIRRRRGGSRSL